MRPAHRGRGLGEALLQHLAALANARGYGRFEWSVLDWNEHAIRFYQRMGATVLPDWRRMPAGAAPGVRPMSRRERHVSETPATAWLRSRGVPFTEHPYD